MPFDPLVSSDHYVAGEVPDIWGLKTGWTIFQPGIVSGSKGEPARLPVYIRDASGGYVPLVFNSEANAANLAAAMNHGKYLREEHEA
jgi:hypothetical protein